MTTDKYNSLLKSAEIYLRKCQWKSPTIEAVDVLHDSIFLKKQKKSIKPLEKFFAESINKDFENYRQSIIFDTIDRNRQRNKEWKKETNYYQKREEKRKANGFYKTKHEIRKANGYYKQYYQKRKLKVA